MPTSATRDAARTQAPVPAQVEMILSQIESLPTLPAVAMRVLELTSDDDSSAREVIKLIESDPSLSARLLSVAGRANVGAAVDTVDRAVVLLGFNAVRNLVLSIQVFETFAQRVEDSSNRFDRVGFWKHCVAVGCAAHLLAQARASGSNHSGSDPGHRSGPAPAARPEEAFVCGLLHDLGKIVLDACFPKSYARVIDKVEAWRGCIADEERAVFGADHTLAGRRLAARWRLPAMIAECIWLHHHEPQATPTRIAYPEHVRLVQAADRLVRQMHIGYSGNYQFDGPLDSAAAILGLSDQTLARITSDLPELIEARAAMIGLERVSSKEVYRETLARANEELARVNAMLVNANRRLEQRSRCLDALCALHAGLSNEATHEEVVRSAACAAGLVTSDRPVAVLGISPSRSLLLATASGAGVDSVRQEVLPLSVVQELLGKPLAPESGLPVSMLPGPVVDRLTILLKEPPACCWPVGDGERLIGAVVATNQIPPDAQEVMRVLLDWLGACLKTAESRSVAGLLSEELAEINRRLSRSQAGLARARSLAMVGEMAAGAAHELNNPLAVISGRAQLLGCSSNDPEVQRCADLIAEHAQRASAIIEELMDFAKPAAPRPRAWSVGRLLGEIRSAWIERNVLGEEQFRLELSDESRKIVADESQIRVLFDEVIRNAVEAMGQRSDPLLVVNCLADVADDRIVIKVQDNGTGMSADVLEHAVDPFFSHRPAGRGRGLGLARAARYAEINGGRIRLSSQVNEGTVVFVELPAAP